MAWVIFDYGGVISSPQPREDLEAMAAVAGSSVPAFWDAYWAHRRAYDLTELTAAAYWRTVADALERYSDGQVPWDSQRVAELVRLDKLSWSHVRPGTVSLIRDAAAAGHKLGILSNAPCEVAEAIAALPVARHFDRLLFSCYLCAAKPDAACFTAALSLLRAEPAEVTFLDDRPENVVAASALGIRAIHFTSPAAARARLPL